MKKQQTLAMVAVTTAVLAGAGTTTFADEVLTTSSVNDVVLLSDDVVDDTIGDVVTPPSTDNNTGNETEPSVPTPPANDEVGGTVKPDVPNNPDAGGDTTKPSKPSQPTNPPITDDAVNKDDQGNITVKPQVVAPNQTVVGTQNGQLLVQDVSGNTRLAEASEFGGQKNENGTVSFKTADGKTVTLPETGESTLGVVVGLLIILAGFGLGVKDKLRALIDKIKAKSKK